MNSCNSKIMISNEKEDLVQAYVDIFTENKRMHKPHIVKPKIKSNKKKLCSSDKVRLQEVTMQLLNAQ